MSLKESTKKEEHDSSVHCPFSSGASVLQASTQNSPENMTPNGEQADLLTHVSFMDSICSDGPAKASYVNGSASPNISDEILLDISRNVPGFLPKSVNAPNTANLNFDECDSLRKDEQVGVRQMLTAEDVENRGIWGFDDESPENSLDAFGDGNDLGWNPQKEFMKFLLEDQEHGEKTNEKTMRLSPPPAKRRKRKMDMVVMVDPSEELCGKDSSNDFLGESSQNSQCSNGTSVAFKHLFPKPAKSRKIQKAREESMESGSENEDEFFQRNSKPKETSPKNHVSFQNPKPFICKECGRAFYNHNSLLKHVAVHQKKRKKLGKEIKRTRDGLIDEGEDAKFQCPQCTYGTNDPNTFVQHAKTHEKDKRYYQCQKCYFVAMNKSELEYHLLKKHQSTNPEYVVMRKRDGVPGQKADGNAAVSFSCKTCPFKSKSKNLVRNHELLPRKICDGELDERLQSPRNSERRSDKERPSLSCKKSRPGLQSLANKKHPSPSEESNEIPAVLEPDKAKRKIPRNEARLDKSGSTPLCRKTHCGEKGSAANSARKNHKITAVSKNSDSGKCSEDSLDSDIFLSGEKEMASTSRRKKQLFALKLKDERRSESVLSPDRNGVGRKNDADEKSDRLHLGKAVLKKSPSKRKMSTPFHNMQGQEILIDFPKCRQVFKKRETSEIRKGGNVEDGLAYDLAPDSSFRFEDGFQASRKRSAQPGDRPDPSHEFTVKEEYVETEVCLEAPDADEALFRNKSRSRSKFGADLKSCHYCPALFESGIALSNHVRGHLHRLGLNYNARHAVSPSRLASRHRAPPVRRRTVSLPQVKTAEVDLSPSDQPPEEPVEDALELTCPLCRDLFDSRTGLSNHVRGHLKRLGKPCSTSTKSPVVILKELMSDKKQFQVKLQALERKCKGSKKFYPFQLSNGLIFTAVKMRRFSQNGRRIGNGHRLAAPRPADEEQHQPHHHRHHHHHHHHQKNKKAPSSSTTTMTEVRDPSKTSPSSDLIGLLKKRRAHDEARAKTLSQTARKVLLVSPVKERATIPQDSTAPDFKPMPDTLLVSEKSDLNRKVCVHCNTTFHSGVSLSNHLRAYARRKRNALLEGTTYDCKQRKQRSRSRKKAFPLLHTPEEIYRLTCRFCDLVFQGPLSVQEDWVKHLQRHIMNTGVPHTGAGMVEVTCIPNTPSSSPSPSPSSSQTHTPTQTHTPS